MKTIGLFPLFCAVTLPLFGAEAPDTGAPPAKPDTSAATNRVRKVEKAPNFVPAKADPLIGDWRGEDGTTAQVYLAAGGKYQANLLTAFDTASNVIAVLHGTSPGETITFTGDGWSGN